MTVLASTLLKRWSWLKSDNAEAQEPSSEMSYVTARPSFERGISVAASMNFGRTPQAARLIQRGEMPVGRSLELLIRFMLRGEKKDQGTAGDVGFVERISSEIQASELVAVPVALKLDLDRLCQPGRISL